MTFAVSMLERVVEEQARGARSRRPTAGRDPDDGGGGLRAAQARFGAGDGVEGGADRRRACGRNISRSGIGPDAEIFTKAPVLSAVGTGVEIGIHPGSNWNNPEPEIALVVSSRAAIVGATLGNDVNLRDFEGRSALLLGKAKDNNASGALGPFVRLFDDAFTLDDVRGAEVKLTVDWRGRLRPRRPSSMARISRDPRISSAR